MPRKLLPSNGASGMKRNVISGDIAIALALGVGVTVAVTVGVGVRVGETAGADNDGVRVGVTVGVGVRLVETDGVGVAVRVTVGVGVAVAVIEGVTEGEGAGWILLSAIPSSSLTTGLTKCLTTEPTIGLITIDYSPCWTPISVSHAVMSGRTTRYTPGVVNTSC